MSNNVPAYTLASVPDPVTVLGIRLQPFSLGHYLLLKRFGSCFVASEQVELSISDLLFGIMICSMTYNQFNEWMSEQNWFDENRFFKPIARRIRKMPFFVRFPWFHRFMLNKWENDMRSWSNEIVKYLNKTENFNVMEKMGMFMAYIKTGSETPHYYIEKEGESDSGGHWSHTVLTTLTGKLGYTHAEAINMPLSKALYDFYKYLENEGCIKLFTEEDEESLALNTKELANA